MDWLDQVFGRTGIIEWRQECAHAVEAAGMGLLYLPPYTLRSHSNDAAHRWNLRLLRADFNPIEQVFAKALLSEVEGLKALLRRATPRSFDAICDALKLILDRFKPAECSNYMRHSGYVQT